MKKLIIALALVTTSCSANQMLQSAPIIGNVCSVAEGTLIDEKVVYAAEALYNMPAHAYVTALEANQLSPTTKALVKPKLIQLYSLLKTIRAAKGTVNCDFNAMKALHADVLELIVRK